MNNDLLTPLVRTYKLIVTCCSSDENTPSIGFELVNELVDTFNTTFSVFTKKRAFPLCHIVSSEVIRDIPKMMNYCISEYFENAVNDLISTTDFEFLKNCFVHMKDEPDIEKNHYYHDAKTILHYSKFMFDRLFYLEDVGLFIAMIFGLFDGSTSDEQKLEKISQTEAIFEELEISLKTFDKNNFGLTDGKQILEIKNQITFDEFKRRWTNPTPLQLLNDRLNKQKNEIDFQLKRSLAENNELLSEIECLEKEITEKNITIENFVAMENSFIKLQEENLNLLSQNAKYKEQIAELEKSILIERKRDKSPKVKQNETEGNKEVQEVLDTMFKQVTDETIQLGKELPQVSINSPINLNSTNLLVGTKSDAVNFNFPLEFLKPMEPNFDELFEDDTPRERREELSQNVFEKTQVVRKILDVMERGLKNFVTFELTETYTLRISEKTLEAGGKFAVEITRLIIKENMAVSHDPVIFSVDLEQVKKGITDFIFEEKGSTIFGEKPLNVVIRVAIEKVKKCILKVPLLTVMKGGNVQTEIDGEKFMIPIAKGIEEGEEVTVDSKIEPVIYKMKVTTTDPVFKRKGADLYTSIEFDSKFKDKTKVVEIKMVDGTSHSFMFFVQDANYLIEGCGLPKGEGFGDLYVKTTLI
ncbi:hypothetical protein EIN_369720 [Entamoeba invadens IP1]|uniref:Uncharacterized protein n=1 Tax=Entamoeba invadens IP1 TaxID=370355 RepID=A0A0A1UBR3_ENTIV|nr:hypothetical protein EIN_369720 [Entamoeba invadens IP1]ELP92650.1 hypothetical protein EIN_369720 [Entamoeba invadens IP1]|eukprot:XP_004259421.1 hypothetical protein EIN_369720 [Entamoeba invadens IP1]